MRKIIIAGSTKIVIDYNDIINLFLHTLNVYGLLGNHGLDYPLREDEAVKKSIDPKILEDVKEGDSYFSYGSLSIYEEGMNHIINNKIWENLIDNSNIRMGVNQKNFGMAFEKCWNEFYKDYWQSSLTEKEKLFTECVNSFDFKEAAEKMRLASHREFPDNFFIFPAEALGHSALLFGNNIVMGNLEIGYDMGFVHEGLHLLLGEEWAKDPVIAGIMEKTDFRDEVYGSWKAKYEQALVVGLDCCIRRKDDLYAEKYHEGCGIGDLYTRSYPLIRNYYINGCRGSIEDLMRELILESEGV